MTRPRRTRPRDPPRGSSVCDADAADPRRFGDRTPGYETTMLYTVFIVLAIIALLMFIFGRRRV